MTLFIRQIWTDERIAYEDTGYNLKLALNVSVSSFSLKNNRPRRMRRIDASMYVNYVCMCVCMYVCMHVRIRLCKSKYVHVGLCMYVCTSVCTYVCTYVSVYVCMHICMYVKYVHNLFVKCLVRIPQKRLTKI